MNIKIYILSIIIIQIILMKLYQMTYLDKLSLFKNIFFGMLILVVFIKSKKKQNNLLTKLQKYHKNYLLLLIIPAVYIFQYMFMPTYLGQDLLALPGTVPGYFFVHLDKLQTKDTIYKDYVHVLDPNLKEGGNNLWYHYTHYQIGDYTYYFIFTSISKYDPMISFWFHYANNKTGEHYHYNEKLNKNKYITKIGTNKNLYAKCNTKTFDFKYKINNYDKTYYIKFNLIQNNLIFEYKGTIQSDYNQFVGRVFPFYLLKPLIPAIDGQITDNNNESFNDQLIITKGISKVNGKLYKNCTSWQDTMNGTDTYYMTTWLWIYQRSENFCIYQLWYSDPEYYNDDNTLKVLYVYDIKNNYVIYNTASKLLPIYKMLTGFKSSTVDTKGTSVQDKEFYYKTHIETQNFVAITETIPNTSIKVCNDKYMYERTDKTIDYGKMEPLAKVMEEVRYDEFSNQSILKIKYNGKEYNEKAQVVVDAMTWKNGWPDGHPKRNNSFFSEIFKLD